MAGTLLSAPTLGASDWSTWITLVDACRRGYLAASYTNFSGSAESALAAGSLVEVAGAVYSFTATAIDYTGAGSANSDLYIYVKPDAVVSTCSVVAWGSAPVWVDAKQGFYASAASTTRAVGGMYVGGAGSYDSKYLYTLEILNYCLQAGSTRPILKKIIDLGEWNMDATAAKTVAHGINNRRDIRKMSAFIRGDGVGAPPDDWVSLECASGTAGAGGYLTIQASASTLVLAGRMSSGIFDNSTYDGTASTIPSRGYVYIEYEA